MSDHPPARSLSAQIEALHQDLVFVIGNRTEDGDVAIQMSILRRWRDDLAALLTSLEPPATPRRMTVEAERLDSVVTALEALQDAGYFLHGPDGQALDRQQFYSAITIGLNAVLAASPARTEP